MECREILCEDRFLYRIVPSGIEIVFAPARENRVVIPSALAGQEVVALAEDYCDDLPAADQAVFVLPHTLRRIPAGVIGRRCRIEIDGNNPVYYIEDHALFRRDAEQGVTLAAFFNNTAEAYEVPEGITCIGEFAFAYASVQMVTLPSSLREIGAHAFLNSALSLLDIPEESVHRIGTGAFSNSLLESVRLPRTLHRIPDSCFAGAKLLHVMIPEGIEEIGAHAFEETGLETVHLPQSLRVLEDTALCGCASLSEIEVDEGNPWLTQMSGLILDAQQTRVLAWPAGQACEELIVPSQVKDIGMAFQGSRGIGTLRIEGCLDALRTGALHADVERIVFKQEPAFVEPDAIRPLHGGTVEVVISMHSQLPAFVDAANISYVFADADDAFREALQKYRFGYEAGGYTITGCTDWQERLEIPQRIGGTPVLRIGSHAFSEKRNGIYPVEIAIPEGVIELKRAAFFWIADSVRQIELPASIQVISEGVFEDADGRYRDLFLHKDILFLTVAGSPADVFLRAYRRHKDDPRGEELIVLSREPEPVWQEPEIKTEEIEIMPQEQESKSEEIETKPEEAKPEPEAESEELETEPEKIEPVAEEPTSEPEEIEPEAEEPTSEPEEIEPEAEEPTSEPEEIEAEMEEAETEMEAGPDIEIPAPAVLPASAAQEEDGLWKVSRKKGKVVRYLGREKQLVYPLQVNGVCITGIADAKKGKKPKPFRKITSVVIPEGYTSIGERAFAGCSKLRSVTLPSTLEIIGKNAFSGCSSLKSVELPEGVRHVGKGTFRDCGIENLIVRSSTLKLKKSVLSGCPKALVYAPFGAQAFKKFRKRALTLKS